MGQLGQRHAAVTGFRHHKAPVAQGLDHDPADTVVVVDHQDGLAGARVDRGVGPHVAGRSLDGRGRRQQQADARALSGNAFDMRPAARLFGHRIDLGEAEAGAAIDVLGGEERVERACGHVARHALAVVGHGDLNPMGRGAGVFGAHRPGRKFQRPALGHGVARVDRQIEQGQFQLVLVGRHPAGVRRDLNFDGDPRAEGLGQQLRHVGDHRLDIHRFEGQALAPGKGQQPRREFGAPYSGVQRAFEISPVGGVGGGALQHNIQAADDRGEQVVEVVGDAAGQLAHRLHLLRLLQPLLLLPPQPHVAQDQPDYQPRNQKTACGHHAPDHKGQPSRAVDQPGGDRHMGRPARGRGRDVGGVVGKAV